MHLNRIPSLELPSLQYDRATQQEMTTCFGHKCVVSSQVVSHFNNDGVNRLHESSPEDTHFIESRMAITEAARTPYQKDHAIILGAGNLTDIPIEFLVENYRKVTLVDIDTDSSKTAVSQRLLGSKKVSICYEQADLTGIMSTVCKDIDQAITELPELNTYGEEANLLELFESKLRNIYQRALSIEKKLPELHGDFVSASLLLSQLSVFVRDYAQDCLVNKYGFSEFSDLTQKTSEFEVLSQKMQVDFLTYLKSVCNADGVIYLGISKSFTIQTKTVESNQWQLDAQETLVKNELVTPWIKQFSSKAKSSWKWHDLNGEGIRRVFDIDAYILCSQRSSSTSGSLAKTT